MARSSFKRRCSWLTPDLKLCLVNGQAVRDKLDVEFCEAGHHLRYKFIPSDEIWVETGISAKERPYIILHELHERALMLKRRWGYSRAHAAASKLESAARHHKTRLKAMLTREGTAS